MAGRRPPLRKLPGIPRATLIVNPSASRVTPDLTAAVERELRATGDVETVLTRAPGHAVELAGSADCDRLFVFSGDGGYNEVVNGLEADVPLGFVPGGGTSVLPRVLGLPRDPVETARLLARSDATRTVSLGRVNGRRFTFSAGLGLDAALVRAIDRRGREHGRRPGDLAFALELAKMLVAARGRMQPALTVLGRGRAAFALVANCDPYSYAGRAPLHVAPDARLEDGLDLIAPVELRPDRLPSVAVSLLLRPRHHEAKWVIHVHDADEIRVECDGPMPLQVDGEDMGDVTDAHFEAERGAVRVLVAPPR